MAEVVTVAREHYADLSAFLGDFPGATFSRELYASRMVHWWDSNPALDDKWERGWLLRSGDQIGGFVANIPSKFQLDGEPITVCNGATFRVLPEFRTQSLELVFKLMREARESILFGTAVIGSAIEIGEKLNVQLVRPEYPGRSVAVTSLGNKIQSYFPDGGIQRPFITGLSTLMSWVPPLWLKKAKLPPGVEVERLDRADEAFDQLWEATKHQFDNTNVRTSAIINWYCFGNPLLKKELFGCYRHGELVGYQICGRSRDPRLKFLDCHDLWTGPGDLEAAKALLFASIDFARQNRLASVSVLHFNSFTEKVCHEVGMVSRKPVATKEFIRVAPKLAPALNAGNSYFVRAQGEYGL